MIRVQNILSPGNLQRNVGKGKIAEVEILISLQDRGPAAIPADVLQKYFPRSYTPQRMQEVIVKLLENWQRKRQQNRER